MKTNLFFALFFSAVLFVGSARSEETFAQAVVIGKIMGPYQAPGKKDDFFSTTIKIIDVKNDFARELKGREMNFYTGTFDPKLIGQIRPLTLIQINGRKPGTIYSFVCTHINGSLLLAGSLTNSLLSGVAK